MDSMKPKVSVLMSVHNGGAFLRLAVDSILAQTLENFEFIVVDDASSDDSMQVLKSFQDRRLKLLPLTANIGLVGALNLALEHARGELIARMDADDESVPDRLRLQVQAMESHPAVVLLGTQYLCVDEGGKPLPSPVLPTDDAVLQRDLMDSNVFCHPSIMLRATAVRAAGGYRALGGRYAQDYDLWLRLAERGEVMNLPQSLLRYRVHGNQVTVRNAVEQKRAAELYRVLARQRRRGVEEDLPAARGAVERMAGRIRAECAADLLRRARLLDQQGEDAQARQLRWRALRQAPLSPAVRQFVQGRFHWYLTRVGLTR